MYFFFSLLLSNKHANHNKPYKKNNMFMNKYKEREKEKIIKKAYQLKNAFKLSKYGRVYK